MKVRAAAALVGVGALFVAVVVAAAAHAEPPFTPFPSPLGSINATGGSGSSGGGGTSVAGTSGEVLAAGTLSSFDDVAGVPRVFKADSNGAGERVNPVGFVVTAVGSGVAVNVQVAGEIAVADALWDAVPGVADVGKMVFMSETAGRVTLTAPSTGGSIVQKVAIVTVGGAGAVKVAIQFGDGVLL